jgi:hypothetical protein
MASLSVNFQLDSISGRIVAPNFCDGDTAQYHPYVIGKKAGCRYRCLMENAQIHFATGLLGAASFSSRNRLLWGLVVPLVTTDFVKKPMAFLG